MSKRQQEAATRYRAAARQSLRGRFDLLRVCRQFGRFLRWRHARPTMQTCAGDIGRGDHFRRPSRPAGEPHESGGRLAVDSLARAVDSRACLVAGNLFCMACPFTLPRSLARALAAGGPAVAAVAAEQMAGGRR